MRLLHTSDWHIGRGFHGESTLPEAADVLRAIADIAAAERVDVVLVAGDVFDHALPSAGAYRVLGDAIGDIRAAGAEIVLTSGNHDSAARLGFQAAFTGGAGVHVRTELASVGEPLVLRDDHGEVRIHALPYLDPAATRQASGDPGIDSQRAAAAWAMGRVRADIEDAGGRSVVLAHCFAAGGRAEDQPRDITVGGLDVVPVPVFDGPDYVALGHLHSPQALTDRVRYSGAPLHLSFAEAGRDRGVWIVDLDGDGLADVRAVALPVPRPLRVLTGTIDEVLGEPVEPSARVSAVLTDEVRPLDAMRRLQERHPGTLHVEHRPPRREADGADYAARVVGVSDADVVAGFLAHVRSGRGPDEAERAILREVLAELASERVE